MSINKMRRNAFGISGPLVWCSVAILLLRATPTSASMIGVSWDSANSAAFSLDERIGSGTFLGFTGFSHLNSLSRNSSGVFYSIGGTNSDILVTIDPTTGMGTFVKVLGSSDFRGVAFSQLDVLYGIRNGGLDELVTIDLISGTVNVVGTTGLPGIQALAFSPSGELFGWDVGSGLGVGLGLVRIDPLTGLASDVNPAVNGRSDEVQGMVFSSDGILFGANVSLYRIDLASGFLTLVGSGGYDDLRGIAFTDSAVPEPSSGQLAAIGIFLLLGFVRQKGRTTP